MIIVSFTKNEKLVPIEYRASNNSFFYSTPSFLITSAMFDEKENARLDVKKGIEPKYEPA